MPRVQPLVTDLEAKITSEVTGEHHLRGLYHEIAKGSHAQVRHGSNGKIRVPIELQLPAPPRTSLPAIALEKVSWKYFLKHKNGKGFGDSAGRQALPNKCKAQDSISITKKGGEGIKTGYSGSHDNSNAQRLRIAVSRHSKGDFPDSSFMSVKPHRGFEMHLCLCDVLMCGTRDLSQGP